MSPAEAQVLLSMAATVDNRKPDADAAKAWAAMLDGLRVEDCMQAIREHYTESTEWLMPAMVRARVKRIRAKRIADHPPLIPPPGLSDAEERQWLAGARRHIGDGNQIDSDAAYELVSGSVRELLAAATPTTDEPPLPRTKEVPQ